MNYPENRHLNFGNHRPHHHWFREDYYCRYFLDRMRLRLNQNFVSHEFLGRDFRLPVQQGIH